MPPDDVYSANSLVSVEPHICIQTDEKYHERVREGSGLCDNKKVKSAHFPMLSSLITYV